MTRLPVLSFHSIDGSGSVVSIAPGEFASTMARLASAGWRGCTLSEALERLGREGDESTRREADGPRCVGLSFDDGYVSVIDEALPVLRDLEFTATVFVVAGRCGGDNRWPGQASWVPTMPLLDWPHLERLVGEGWEIGSHGLEHLPLTAVGGTEAAREVGGARDRLRSRLGVPARLFAYPYGAHDATARAIVRDAHAAAFVDRPGLVAARDLASPFRLPRIDAHYLRVVPVEAAISGSLGRAYLTLRRWAGSLHRRHWDAGDLDARGGHSSG